MGKGKEHKAETFGNAFSRMNFLYQAARLITKMDSSQTNPLSNYYNKIMKEISKKVVEKLHPDLKRSICCACNYPLTAESNQMNVKIKSNRKKKKKNGLSNKTPTKKILSFKYSNTAQLNKYLKNRIEMRNKWPNKIRWSCAKCGFSKSYLQKPSYKLWVHENNL